MNRNGKPGVNKLMKFGRRRKVDKKLEEAMQEERKKKMEAFLSDYRIVSQKHKLDIIAELNITPKGITPAMKIIDMPPPPEPPTK